MKAYGATCESCRFWTEFEDEHYGQCEKITPHSAWNYDQLADDVVAYIPADLDAPRLRTAPDFGCILWQPSPPDRRGIMSDTHDTDHASAIHSLTGQRYMSLHVAQQINKHADALQAALEASEARGLQWCEYARRLENLAVKGFVPGDIAALRREVFGDAALPNQGTES